MLQVLPPACEIHALFQGTAKDQMLWAAPGHVSVAVNWLTLKR